MARACEGRFRDLVAQGCAVDVAADRTFDALLAAEGFVDHCCDPRDRLFERQLRDITERQHGQEESN